MKLIETLKSFGLSEYEAKVMLTLISKGELTAKEIAEHSNIPRTSVYDVVTSLTNKGLVESYGSKPLRFRALKVKEIINILEKKVKDELNLLKKELPAIESNVEVEEVRIYRGDTVLSKLAELVESSKEKIVAVLSYIPNEIKAMLENAKCKVTIASSNASVVKNAETYEFHKKVEHEACHGLIVFDDRVVMMLFLNSVSLAIVGDGRGFVSLYTMLLNFFLERAMLTKK